MTTKFASANVQKCSFLRIQSLKHTWLSMYIQGLLLNEKESLIPKDCHCGETNCTGYDPNILVSTRK